MKEAQFPMRVGLGQAIGHRMHGNLPGLPVRVVRMLMVVRTRSFDRVQRLLQYNLLEWLQ